MRRISIAAYAVEVHPVRKSEPSFLKFQEGEKAGSVYKAFHKELSALQKSAATARPTLTY